MPRPSIVNRFVRFVRRLVLGWRNPGRFGPLGGRDPYAGVRQPRGRAPGGRSAAVALAEPDEYDTSASH